MAIRAALTNGHVSDAIRLANSGEATLQEWADVREPGLRLRVRGHDAKWLLRYKSQTVTLGPASRWTVERAREAASHVRGLIKSRVDPKPWIDARMAGANATEAAEVVLRRKGKERGEWTLATLMERYRDDHVKVGRVVHGVRRPPSANTLKDVDAMMGQKPYADISALLVRELDERALENYRNKLTKAHGGSASRKGLAYLKAALSWARRNHAASAGLSGGRWWLDVNALHVEKKRQRAPTLEDIAMTIALAEAVAKRMPGRSISAGMHESTMSALWLLVFTSLRREAVVTIERGELIDDARDSDGWGILYRPREVMKSRREHALPIPPAAMAILRPALDRNSNSQWLLPAARLARDGSETHVHGSAINKLLLRLRGMDDPKGTSESVDLMTLAGVSVPDWSPHDIRRTFATLVEDWTTRGDAVSAVLDHEGTGADTDSKGAAAITRTAYSQSQRLTLKRLAMEPWCNAIIQAVEDARPKASAIVVSVSGLT